MASRATGNSCSSCSSASAWASSTASAVAFLDISPLVMTLGMNSILQGVVLIYSSGSPIGQAPPVRDDDLDRLVHGIPYVVLLWLGLTSPSRSSSSSRRSGAASTGGANRRASALSGLPVRRTVAPATPERARGGGRRHAARRATRARRTSARGTSTSCPRSPSSSSAAPRSSAARARTCRRSAGALLITVITSSLVTGNVDQAGRDILYGVDHPRDGVLQPGGARGRAAHGLVRRSVWLASGGWRSRPARRPDADPTKILDTRATKASLIMRRTCGLRHRRGGRHRPGDLPGVLRRRLPRGADRPRPGRGLGGRRARSIRPASERRHRVRCLLDRVRGRHGRGGRRALRPPRRARQHRRRRRSRPSEELSDASWDRLISIHLGGAFRCSRAAFRRSRRAGTARS